MGKRLIVVVAVLALFAVMLGAYFIGYVCLGKRTLIREVTGISDHQPVISVHWERTYPRQWQVVLFMPAAGFEGLVEGHRIEIRQSQIWDNGTTLHDNQRDVERDLRLNEEINKLPDLEVSSGQQSVTYQTHDQ